MNNSVNFNIIPANRPASWKQKIAINTRVGLLVAGEGGELTKEIRQAVSKILTNKLTHGEVQKYFKIDSIKDIDGKILKSIKDTLEGKPTAKKAAPKKSVVISTAKKTPVVKQSGNEDIMNMMKIMMNEISEMNSKFTSQIEDINSRLG